jgi:DNA (cytosine-5)-methyltransferase 1
MPSHPVPEFSPLPCGPALRGVVTPEEQLKRLLKAGRKYRAFKYWDRIRVGRSEMPLTGQGFNAIKFDPQKPAHTIRRNGGNLGMSGAMHWAERRRFSLPEFKRFASFPDDFEFAGSFDEGIRQIGNCVPPLFMRAMGRHIRYRVLSQ